MAYTEKDKEYRHQYYLKHREETIASNREWRAKNPEKRKEQYRRHNQKQREQRNAYRREWWRKHSAGDSKEAKAYKERKNVRRREVLAGNSEEAKAYRERQKVHKRRYFLEHHDHVSELYRARIAWFYELKRNTKCAVCGRSFPDCPDVIEFHHTKGRESGRTRIGNMVTGKAPKERVLAEIKKCTPLCANCHRRVHYLIKQRKRKERPASVSQVLPGISEAAKTYKEREKIRTRKYFLEHHDRVLARYRDSIAWFYDLKKGLKCAVCGQSFPDCPDIIDFHHVKGKESDKNQIASMVTGKVPKERILAEIEKCTPLCANCHRKVHYLIKQRKDKERSERPTGGANTNRIMMPCRVGA